MSLNAAVVRERLRLPAEALPAVETIGNNGPAAPVALPDQASIGEVLRRLGLSTVDLDETLAARPSRQDDPELWWLLEHCHQQLVARMGEPGMLPPWPDLTHLGEKGRYFYVWALIAALPDVRRYHAERGIPDDLSWRILGELASQMANRRVVFGEGGLHTHNWMTVHFRGVIYALGRLLFERTSIDFDQATGAAPLPEKGEPALGIHIPSGRLTPESCDASLNAAPEFFAAHFPEEPYRFGICSSWVLDPALNEYLAPDTNILHFQRRFTLLPPGQDNSDADTVEAVFKRPLSELDSLPTDTSLQRGVIKHIRAGRHWQYRTGWLRL
jgi:hypothetical protein